MQNRDSSIDNPPFPDIAAVIVAAGAGLRAGQPLPKQFALWRGRPVVRHSVAALAQAGASPIVVVIPAGAEAVAASALTGIDGLRLVVGGATRQESVHAGLAALAQDRPDHVLIHDAARPDVPPAVITRLIAALEGHAGAIPVLPVVDSMIHTRDEVSGATGGNALMGTAADRAALRRVQTPQAFAYPAILAAHQAWAGPPVAGDDAQVAAAAGLDIALVAGDEALHKLTFPDDFVAAKAGLLPLRVGTGYDVHRLADGEDLWLCGVRLDHHQGLAGHSDADVAIHALVDALLGAVAAGDIGQHFPPSDARWRGAASDQFLAHAVDLVRQAGYGVGQVDVTIICEAPRIGPHRTAMRDRLAGIMGVDGAMVSVKATTTERLGFTGRAEGIAAQAVATVMRL